jgi:Chaperone of endosialidase
MNLIDRSDFATVSGGQSNSVYGDFGTIPGGLNNVATNYAFAAGNNAQATNQGALVWSDGTGTLTTSTNNNSVTFRASGGYRFFSSTANTAFAYLAPGSGSWTSLSDRNGKEHFEPINAYAVLEKVAALPVTTWNYKSQSASVRHIGPTAQDFMAAFKVGETDTGISTVDEGGVALAAIQGLNQKLNEKDAEIKGLKQSVAELRALVEKLAGK